MYRITLSRRQGKDTCYNASDKIRIHGNFIEIPLGQETRYIALNGVEEITQTEVDDAAGEVGELPV